jgi:hypothetical protein
MTCLIFVALPELLVYVLALAVIRISERRRRALMSYRMLVCVDGRLKDVNRAPLPAQPQQAPVPAQQLCEAEIHE